MKLSTCVLSANVEKTVQQIFTIFVEFLNFFEILQFFVILTKLDTHDLLANMQKNCGTDFRNFAIKILVSAGTAKELFMLTGLL